MKCGLQEMPSFKLVSGVGNYDDGKACVMSAAVACYRLSRGKPMGEATDQMECCCRVIRSFLIRLNDSSLWRNDDHRTEVLMPFVSRLAGTKNPDLTQQRLYILADWAIRTIAADAMDIAKLPEQAAKLRSLSEVCDIPTANSAKTASRGARADADAAAVCCVYAAAAAAGYAAAAAGYATSAADADARRTAKGPVIAKCVAILERLISLSE